MLWWHCSRRGRRWRRKWFSSTLLTGQGWPRTNVFVFPPLPEALPRQLQSLTYERVHRSCTSHVVIWMKNRLARQTTYSCIFGLSYICMQMPIKSDRPLIKWLCRTYSSHTLLHESAIFHNASEYYGGGWLDGCGSRIMSVSVSWLHRYLHKFREGSWQAYRMTLLRPPSDAHAS